MNRDAVSWTTSRLTGPWSAEVAAADLDASLLVQISTVFHRLDPLVRVRLLVACCLLKGGRRQELQASIMHLLHKATQDDSEWVRFFGHALDARDGSIKLEKALAALPEVQSTACALRQKVQSSDDGKIAPWLHAPQLDYLSDHAKQSSLHRYAPEPDEQHFTLRASGHEHATLLQGSRAGLASIVAAAAASDTGAYASLLSGSAAAIAPVAVPQKQREPAMPMLVRSTTSHFKTPTHLRKEAHGNLMRSDADAPARKRLAVHVDHASAAAPAHADASSVPLELPATSPVQRLQSGEGPLRDASPTALGAAQAQGGAAQSPEAVQQAGKSATGHQAAQLHQQQVADDDSSDEDEDDDGLAPNVF